ncbi:MAG: S4 domain-containing protein, partial [Methylocella sp.]
EATAMVHGREAALRAAGAARKTFVKLETSEAPDIAASVDSVSGGLPTVEIPAAEIEAGLGVLTAFVRSKLVASTGEARRQIKGGGLKVNDQAVTDERMVIGPRDLTGGAVKLSLGRKRHVLLKIA